MNYKKIITISLILVLSFSLTGCMEDIFSGKVSTTKTGSINGIIKNNEGKTLSGVSVNIGNKNATTNQEGLFKINELQTGGYNLVVNHSDYQKKDVSITV